MGVAAAPPPPNLPPPPPPAACARASAPARSASPKTASSRQPQPCCPSARRACRPHSRCRSRWRPPPGGRRRPRPRNPSRGSCCARTAWKRRRQRGGRRRCPCSRAVTASVPTPGARRRPSRRRTPAAGAACAAANPTTQGAGGGRTPAMGTRAHAQSGGWLRVVGPVWGGGAGVMSTCPQHSPAGNRRLPGRHSHPFPPRRLPQRLQGHERHRHSRRQRDQQRRTQHQQRRRQQPAQRSGQQGGRWAGRRSRPRQLSGRAGDHRQGHAPCKWVAAAPLVSVFDAAVRFTPPCMALPLSAGSRPAAVALPRFLGAGDGDGAPPLPPLWTLLRWSPPARRRERPLEHSSLRPAARLRARRPPCTRPCLHRPLARTLTPPPPRPAPPQNPAGPAPLLVCMGPCLRAFHLSCILQPPPSEEAAATAAADEAAAAAAEAGPSHRRGGQPSAAALREAGTAAVRRAAAAGQLPGLLQEGHWFCPECASGIMRCLYCGEYGAGEGAGRARGGRGTRCCLRPCLPVLPGCLHRRM